MTAIRLTRPPLLALTLALSVLVLSGCGNVSLGTRDDAAGTATGTAGPGTSVAGAAGGKPTPRPTIDRRIARVVTADGAMRYPDEPHTLAFGTSGLVVELNAADRQEVAQGEVLARLETLPLDLAVAEARAALAGAQARVTQLETGSTINQAKIEVERAKNSLWGNQASRDAQCGRADDGNLPGSIRDEARTSCDGAQAGVQASEQGVKLAEESLRQAEATAGDDLAAARAQLESARLSLRQAEVSLNKVTLVAPFAGTLSDVRIRVGEPASPGSPAMSLTQTRPLRFVTTNLGERFIGDIEAGDAAEVILTAYPDQPLKATVHRIEDQGTSDASGAVVFAVYLDVEEDPDLSLRAGMTGRVEITVGG
jgi:HlyD family secretion protein